jgi:choice-of-anchor C domain-containing protein
MNSARLATFILAVAMVPSIARSNLIQNGNFASGPSSSDPNCNVGNCTEYPGSTAIPGWQVLFGNINYNLSEIQAPPQGGKIIDIDGQNSGGIGQSFKTVAGHFYQVNFYFTGNPCLIVADDPVKIMEVTAGDFDSTFSYDISVHKNSFFNLQFVDESFEFKATSNSTLLSFLSKDPTSSWCGPMIADVAATPLPIDGEFQVHAFTGPAINSDGAAPSSQLVPDANDNLFGTTVAGGANQCESGSTTVSCGTLFSLVPNSAGTGWTQQTLYSFSQNAWAPSGRLTYFKANGMLYGTALYGGGTGCGGLGCGAVMQFTAPTNGASSSAAVLYQFSGGAGGGLPNAHLLQDASTGVLYGTTRQGGTDGCGGTGCGVVFMLTPPVSGSTWTETVLYRFTGGKDGANPVDINMDTAGNIFGATSGGGVYGKGVVFELATTAKGLWPETVVHAFGRGYDGAVPASGVIIDKDGTMYGTTSQGGGSPNCDGGCGMIYQLSSPVNASPVVETALYRFRGGVDGKDPQANLIFDSSTTTLYGTAAGGGGSKTCVGGCGVVFKLTPAASATAWTETPLHRFAGGDDGANPMAGLHMDSAGRLYGATAAGGSSNLGTAFQLQ